MKAKELILIFQENPEAEVTIEYYIPDGDGLTDDARYDKDSITVSKYGINILIGI